MQYVRPGTALGCMRLPSRLTFDGVHNYAWDADGNLGETGGNGDGLNRAIFTLRRRGGARLEK